MTQDVEIFVDDHVIVNAPYHPDFPERAKLLGGKYLSMTKSWRFDLRDEEAVRNLCAAVYGTDGRAPVPMVTVRVAARLFKRDKDAWCCGRQIASRRYPDAPPRLGDGVVLIEGGFESRGGSRKNPKLAPLPGTILEVRAVPLPLAERAVVEHLGAVDIVDDLEEIENPPSPLLAGASDEELVAELTRRGYTVHSPE